PHLRRVRSRRNRVWSTARSRAPGRSSPSRCSAASCSRAVLSCSQDSTWRWLSPRSRALQGRGRKPMKIRTIIAATCATLVFSMAGPIYAHDSVAQTVRKNFEAAIPNIAGKSVLAVEVDYTPGAAPHPREVGFHLRLWDLGRDRVEGE